MNLIKALFIILVMLALQSKEKIKIFRKSLLIFWYNLKNYFKNNFGNRINDKKRSYF